MNLISQLALTTWFDRTAAVMAGALVAGLWQGTALVLMAGFALKFLPRTSAAVRFLIWTVVFAASAAVPFLHLAAAAKAVGTHSPGHLLLDTRWSYLLAILWVSASTFRLTVLSVEIVAIRQLWGASEPISEELLQNTGLLSSVARRGVKVCTTSEVDRPSVIGFFAPRILIPTWLLAQLSETELRHLVLHEMEHLRRRDDWLNLLQKVGLVFFPLSPALCWIDRRLSSEREIACDDGVLARTNAPRAYASSLTSIAERRIGHQARRRTVALALGALGAGALMRRRSEFAVRIESILGARSTCHPALAAMVVAGVLGGTAVMANAPDLVTFGYPVPAAMAGSSIADQVLPTTFHVQPSARMENVSYRVASTPTQKMIKRSHPAKYSQLYRPTLSAVEARPARDRHVAPQKTASSARGSQRANQWTVLTSWESTPYRQQEVSPETETEAGTEIGTKAGTDALVPVSRILLRTADGRFFVAPYAAVPTRAGWLIVQL